MGLLDDAIRDHLDLKRRHGADPAELERAAREALGPVRRKGDVAAAGSADDADEPFAENADAPAASRPFAYNQAEDDWDYPGEESVAVGDPLDPELDEPPPGRESRRARRAAADADPDDEPDQPRGLAARFGLRGRRSVEDHDEEDEPDLDEPLAEDEPTRVHRTERPADRAPAPTGGETAEYDVDEALHGEKAADAAEDDDMLEETPEFLQDTPDHDRLWFEQKPPRDFDFDG
jgi:hypothetical protein